MSNPDAISHAKRSLRTHMRATLAAMKADERAAASAEACRRVAAMTEFAGAATVMLYLPLPGEADCSNLIADALRRDRSVCVPHVDWNSRSMLAARITSLNAEDFVIDRHHVRIPRRIEEIPIDGIECVIVPGLAFDEQGRRLGRGGGFYDRFLARLPASVPTIALAFERQIVADLPATTHDSGVRLIATERRVLHCH